MVKKFLMVLLCLSICGEVDAKGKGKGKGSKENPAVTRRRNVLNKQRTRKYTEITDKLLRDIENAEKSIASLEKVLQTKDGKRKEKYYSGRLKAKEKVLEKAQEEYDWVEQCYKKKQSRTSRKYKNPFDKLDRMFDSLPSKTRK